MRTIFNKIKNIFYRSSDNRLTYSEVRNIMQTNYNTVLLDVRSVQEFREGHLTSAINLPVYDLARRIESEVQDKSSIIILYCQTEIRSIKAKKILKRMGYINIYILKGGIDGIV